VKKKPKRFCNVFVFAGKLLNSVRLCLKSKTVLLGEETLPVINKFRNANSDKCDAKKRKSSHKDVCSCLCVCERECSTVDIIWDAIPILKPLTNKYDTMKK